MKLLSTTRDSNRNRLVCEDAVFDPNLMKVTQVDAIEKVVTFTYDFSECGHPLNLPFEARAVEFMAKLTPYDIHICATIEVDDDIDDEYSEFVGDFGEIEFDIKMDVEEKNALLRSITLFLLDIYKSQR